MMTAPNASGETNPGFVEDDVNIELSSLPSQPSEKKDVEAGVTEELEVEHGLCTRVVLYIRLAAFTTVTNHKKLFKVILLVIFSLLCLSYFLRVVQQIIVSGEDVDWCRGRGFIVIVYCIALFIICYYLIIKKFFGKFLLQSCIDPLTQKWEEIMKFRFARWGIYAVLAAAFIVTILVDSLGDSERLRSVVGLIFFLVIGFLFSKCPEKIKWSQIWWGLGLQIVFGAMILRWPVGQDVFQCMGNKTRHFLDFTDDGSSFVYGEFIVKEKGVFYFKALSVIYFFSFFVQILQYYGILQVMVEKFGWLLFVTIGTTACESMNAAANIFLGQTEAPLLIKPYLTKMTKSELHAVMTGGFATIAGSVLAAYISFGVDAAHLLGASVMSAPAALAYAKLFYPEDEVSVTDHKKLAIEKGQDANFLDAASKGASGAILLVLNIGANLIAFTACISFLNATVAWIFLQLGIHETITFEWILSYLFYPLAWLMGVSGDECLIVGELLGIKTVVNEFVAYERLHDYNLTVRKLTFRSQVIAVYSLCGFSNFASIGVQLGSLGGMAPTRRRDLAEVAFRSFLSGSAACFMTACIAGMLVPSPPM